jgi:mRNA interferase RelE/StbE
MKFSTFWKIKRESRIQEKLCKGFKKKSDNRKLMSKAREVIEQVEEAEDLHCIANLKKLKADGSYYRIRSGDYRFGLAIENERLFLSDFCTATKYIDSSRKRLPPPRAIPVNGPVMAIATSVVALGGS